MTFGEALNITIVSMFIVFILLMVLMVIIKIQAFLVNFFSNIFKNINKKSVNSTANKLQTIDNSVSKQDDLEVVAAITAALSCCMNVPQEKLVIRSIKRTNSNNSVWGNANLN